MTENEKKGTRGRKRRDYEVSKLNNRVPLLTVQKLKEISNYAASGKRIFPSDTAALVHMVENEYAKYEKRNEDPAAAAIQQQEEWIREYMKANDLEDHEDGRSLALYEYFNKLNIGNVPEEEAFILPSILPKS